MPDAVNGATELLVASALERLREEGAPGAAFALAPMRGMREQIDPRARWLGWVLEGVIRTLDRRYGFRAIARYEARFAPTEWRPRYVGVPPGPPQACGRPRRRRGARPLAARAPASASLARAAETACASASSRSSSGSKTGGSPPVVWAAACASSQSASQGLRGRSGPWR